MRIVEELMEIWPNEVYDIPPGAIMASRGEMMVIVNQ